MILWSLSLCFASDSTAVQEKVASSHHVDKAIVHYIEQLKISPDPALYHSLSTLLDIKQEKECAIAAKRRAQNMEIFPTEAHDTHTFPSFVWPWLGVLLCYSIWFIRPRRIYAALIMGLGISMLAFFPRIRYQGSILYRDTPIVHIPTLTGVELANIQKGTVVRIFEAQQGFLKIQFSNKEGWVHRESVVSWNPYDVFNCFDTPPNLEK